MVAGLRPRSRSPARPGPVHMRRGARRPVSGATREAKPAVPRRPTPSRAAWLRLRRTFDRQQLLRDLTPEATPNAGAGGGTRILATRTALTTAVALVITAVLTVSGSFLQNAFQDLFWPQPATQRAIEETGALSLEIPSGWSYQTVAPEVQYGHAYPATEKTAYAGVAFAGWSKEGVPSQGDLSLPLVFMSASAEAAEELGLVGAGRRELRGWAEEYLESEDYSGEGCRQLSTERVLVPGYQAVLSKWGACDRFVDSEIWELAGARDDGAVLVTVQLKRPPSLSEEESLEMVTSFDVVAARLP